MTVVVESAQKYIKGWMLRPALPRKNQNVSLRCTGHVAHLAAVYLSVQFIIQQLGTPAQKKKKKKKIKFAPIGEIRVKQVGRALSSLFSRRTTTTLRPESTMHMPQHVQLS